MASTWKRLLAIIVLMVLTAGSVLGAAPVANDVTDTTPEDTAVTITLDYNNDDLSVPADGEDPATSATVTVTSGGSITTPASCTAAGVCTVGLTPTTNSIANIVATYTVSDAEPSTSNSATITITVGAVNDPPVLSNPSPASPVSINEGTSQSFSITATDADGDALTYEWKLDGTTVATASTFTYAAPAVDAAASHTLLLTVRDAITSETFTWAITVNNVIPTASSDQTKYNSLKVDYDDAKDDYFEFRRAYEKYEDRDDQERVDRYKEKLEDVQDELADIVEDARDLQEDIEDRSTTDKNLLSDAEDLEDDADDLIAKIDRLLNGNEPSSLDFYNDNQATSTPPAARAPAEPATTVVYSQLPPEALQQVTPGNQQQNQATDYTPLVILGAGIIIMVAVLIFLMILLFRK